MTEEATDARRVYQRHFQEALNALFSGGGGDLVHYVEAKTVEYGIGICRTRFGRSDAECNLRF